MTRKNSASFFLSLLLFFPALLSPGCTGSGSDIGPHAPSRAKSFLRGIVVDTRGNPLVSALVRLEDGEEAVTGKTGRFSFSYPKPGLHVLEVDGRNAAALGGERVGRLRFRAAVLGGPHDMDHRAVLPDLNQGASAQVPVGTLSSEVTLDGGEARVTLPAGTNVSLTGASGSFTLGLGLLGEADLPVPLSSTGGILLAGKAAVLDPPAAEFTPSATLSVENTLGLSGGEETLLFRLDPSTGEWVEAGKGRVEDSGARIDASLGITGGGIYVFAASLPSTAGAYVSGLVKNLEGLPVQGALVQGPEGRSAFVLADGSFQVGPFSRVDGAGNPRRLSLLVRSSGGWTSKRLSTSLTMNPSGDTEAGTLVLDAVPSAALSVVAAYRGRILPFKKVLGGTGDMVLQGRLNEKGYLVWEEVPLGRAGSRMSWISGRKWYRGSSQRDLETRDGWYEARLLTAEGNSRPDNVDRTLAVRVVAAGGGGPLPGTMLFLGDGPDPFALGTSDYDAFHSFYGVRGPQKITACRLFERGGKKLRSVLTYDGVDNSFFDFPLTVLSRSTGSPLDPFGVVEGTLQGGRGGTLGVAGRPRLDEWDLREAFLEGTDPASSVPLLQGPPGFRAGVPRWGSLTGWETDPSTGALVRVGFLLDLAMEPGKTLEKDLSLDLPASAVLDIQGPEASRDPSLSSSNFTCDLGILLPAGQALLVKEDLVPQLQGTSLRLSAPPLSGFPKGASYLVEVEVSGSSGGIERTQKVLAKGETLALTAPFLGLPVLTKPSPGAQVGEGELEAAWRVPAGTTAVRLLAEWTKGEEKGRWEVWLRPDRKSFKFFELPKKAFSFLPPSGTAVTLTLTCYHHEGSYLSEEYPFDRFAGA
ncbi:MAG TPA: carboxypeptidase regulatory-like domain-containing protein, partial [Planctomycetes bacterium]|nr:carboxypeptidase regulatory-like domain-containing protein [Planctomycetota bacterium]